jgi:hypothetical protein
MTGAVDAALRIRHPVVLKTVVERALEHPGSRRSVLIVVSLLRAPFAFPRQAFPFH